MRLRACSWSCVAGALVGGLVPSAHAGKACPPKYTAEFFINSEQCGWPSFWIPGLSPEIITDGGAVAGTWNASICDGFPKQLAFTWEAGFESVTVDFPPGYHTVHVYDMSETGAIVGQVIGGGIGWGYRYEDGAIDYFPQLPGDTSSSIFAINEAGMLVGESRNSISGGPKAMVWKDGKAINITADLGGAKGIAYDVNEAGQVAAMRGSTGQGGGVPMIWEDGNVQNLPLPRNAVGADYLCINEHGEAGAIWYFKSGTKTIKRSCVWIDGEFLDLGIKPDCQNILLTDFNDRQEAVGYHDKCDSFGNHPFVWKNGQLWYLNELMGFPPSAQIYYPDSINNSGQIACTCDVIIGIGDTLVGTAVLTPMPSLLADLNCDEVVDESDLSLLLNAWGSRDASCDLDDNLTVDGADLGILLGSWSS